MRSNKQRKKENIVLNAHNEFWKMFGSASVMRDHSFSFEDICDDEPIKLDDNSTLVDLSRFPGDLWLTYYTPTSDMIDNFNVKAVLADLFCTMGVEKTSEALLKSMRAAEKLMMDISPYEIDVVDSMMEKALDAQLGNAARIYEMYKAAEGSPMEDTVKEDLVAMFPGELFMVLWYGLLAEFNENDGVYRIYKYDADGMTLEDAVRLFSSTTVDYAHKLRRMYRESVTIDGGSDG